ncbi:MAG: F0F1 ATP synthase subunit epsilon [Candidatus Egerieousia sp.]
MQNLHLTIISPVEKLYDGDVTLVKLPGKVAPFTVLDKHAPIISSLAAGPIVFVSAGAENESSIDIEGGFVEVSDNVVTVCVS